MHLRNVQGLRLRYNLRAMQGQPFLISLITWNIKQVWKWKKWDMNRGINSVCQPHFPIGIMHLPLSFCTLASQSLGHHDPSQLHDIIDEFQSNTKNLPANMPEWTKIISKSMDQPLNIQVFLHVQRLYHGNLMLFISKIIIIRWNRFTKICHLTYSTVAYIRFYTTNSKWWWWWWWW